MSSKWIECDKPENQTPERAIPLAVQAIIAVHKAFGAPGNYGYGHPEGQALQFLYAAGTMLSKVNKSLKEAAEPSTTTGDCLP